MDIDVSNAAKYRRCFTAADGPGVLAHLLSEMGFFSETDDETTAVTRRFAAKMLRDMGITDTVEKIEYIVRQMLELPITPQTEGEPE